MDECIFEFKTNAQELSFLENIRLQLGFTSLNDFIKFCLKITVDILTYPNLKQLQNQTGVIALGDFIRYCIKMVELDLKSKQEKELKKNDSKRGVKSR